MFSHNAVNMVNKATRYPIGNQRGDPSLLDHVWTNQPLLVKNIDLIVNPISDHRPTLVTIQEKFDLNQINQNITHTRDFRHFNEEAYNDSLYEFHQRDLTNLDIHQKFALLQTHMQGSLNKHAPFRELTKKEQKIKASPWLSRGILTSINNKNKLYLFIQTNSRIDLNPLYNKMKKR